MGAGARVHPRFDDPSSPQGRRGSPQRAQGRLLLPAAEGEERCGGFCAVLSLVVPPVQPYTNPRPSDAGADTRAVHSFPRAQCTRSRGSSTPSSTPRHADADAGATAAAAKPQEQGGAAGSEEQLPSGLLLFSFRNPERSTRFQGRQLDCVPLGERRVVVPACVAPAVGRPLLHFTF